MSLTRRSFLLRTTAAVAVAPPIVEEMVAAPAAMLEGTYDFNTANLVYEGYERYSYITYPMSDGLPPWLKQYYEEALNKAFKVSS